MPGRVLPCGERALLIELDTLPEVVAVASAVREWPEVIDVIPAAQTVLIVVEHPSGLPALRRAVAALMARDLHSAQSAPESRRITIAVHYDGPDLDEVATLTGLSRAEVIEAHIGTDWTAAFGGFAPGFCYLSGGDPRLEVPRREQPRTSVPAGAVGLAGPFTGVYPRSSPGGWQLIGRTAEVLWDLTRTPPALIAPGDTVRFVAVDRPGQ
ncbi:MAG: 5-oxoprolinase subunit PxpB [Micropruina sp.]|nr:5-oxoprolinase subunit PxpB [Micropruina sp.]